jgi:hypothetical protein
MHEDHRNRHLPLLQLTLVGAPDHGGPVFYSL